MTIDPARGSPAHATQRTRRVRPRRRRVKPEAEIVLLCNPRAGGRWKELARILDSEEARYARRIVTDSVEDVASALADLGSDTRLVCVYGGDGTIQRVLDRMTENELEHVVLALLGGGTMNVTSRWLGFAKKPANNFRHVVRAFRSGELLHREVPILEVETGDDFFRCFTFGMGPVIRLLDAYEQGKKGKLRALGVAARAAAATWIGRPSSMAELIAPMRARVEIDGETLPYHDYSAVFANVTGQINPGVEPFIGPRDRDNFHCAAYAVSAREMATALPMLVRGWLPVDMRELLMRPFGRDREDRIPKDPRYVNRPGENLVIESDEHIYTADGEILPVRGPVIVHVGPILKLAAGPRFDERVRLAAEAMVSR